MPLYMRDEKGKDHEIGSMDVWATYFVGNSLDPTPANRKRADRYVSMIQSPWLKKRAECIVAIRFKEPTRRFSAAIRRWARKFLHDSDPKVIEARRKRQEAKRRREDLKAEKKRREWERKHPYAQPKVIYVESSGGGHHCDRCCPANHIPGPGGMW